MATRTKDRKPVHTPKIKLQPPRRPAAHVWRPRLERVVDSAPERRLTIVVAGPGFGKSTLVATRALDQGWAWYRADPGDAVLTTFASGLRDALLSVMPAFAGAIPDEALSADAEELAASFGQALDTALEDELVLVVDDVHELGAGTGPARFLEGLLRQAPGELHLVLCSREEAPFPVERLLGQGQAVQVDSGALALTHEEIEVLLLDVGADLSEFAGALHEVTGGWPAAVQLGAQMLASTPPEERSRPVPTVKRRGGPVFTYLAEEVFRREPEELTELLRRVAPLESFSIELCEALGLPDPAEKLAHLQRRGFVVAGREQADWLTLHPLLREFVRESWPLDDDERRDVQKVAARWSESKGLLREALAGWREADEPEEIVRLFHERTGELIDGGLAGAVVEAAGVVPAELLDFDAKALVAMCHGCLGESEDELRYLQELAAGGVESNTYVSFQLGHRSLVQGRYREAIETLLSGDWVHPMHLAFAAYAHFRLGELDVSRKCALQALEEGRRSGQLTSQAESRMALADICMAEGDLATAENQLELALELTIRDGNVLAECSARTRNAELRLAQGRYADALEEAEDALALAGRIGFAVFLAWVRVIRGQVHRSLGRLDEAAADFTSGATRYGQLAADSQSWALVNLARVHRDRGDLAQARSACETALEVCQQSEDAGSESCALAELALVIVSDEAERAAECADRAVANGGLARGTAVLERGWVALARGERDAAEADASRAVAEARRAGTRASLAEALELQACVMEDGRALFEEAIAIWRELGSPIAEARVELALAVRTDAPVDETRARKRLRRLGVRDGAFRAAGLLMTVGTRGAAPLVIHALGEFEVLRSGEPVAANEWKSKKARDLLKLLVAARGRPLTREQLIEALWPGEPPEKTGNRLSVALSTVRTVLDPERREDSDYFVSAEKGSVRLRLEHADVDVESFLAEARAAFAAWRTDRSEETRLLLEDAEQAYSGDFLAEDRYEEWASPLREEVRSVYVEVLRTLARSTSGREAARYELRILEGDPYDEQAHVRLVSSLLEGGAHGEARRAYGTYVTRMAEIEVEPIDFAALQEA